MIRINVNGSVVSVQETEALYCGAQAVYTCSFAFDRSWDSFLKSAVFRVNSRAITAVIDENNSCVLPWELLVRDHIGSNIEVGVYGVSAEREILTSVWDSIGTVREGSELGSDAREPSSGVYEQVMASIRRVDDKIVSYSSEVQTLTQRAESAAAVAAADSKAAGESERIAVDAAESATGAMDAVLSALNNVPAGGTVIVNDLITGGTTAALSAEMGKMLNSNKLNKSDRPAGTYAGTGDAAAQVIDTKGTGKGIFIYGGGMGALAAPNGCVGWYTSNGTVTTLPSTQVAFANGKLTIATTSDFVNRSGVSYAYQVF